MTAALDGGAWGVLDAAELVAAIDVELAEQATADRALVAKGRLTDEQADCRARVVADISLDLRFAFAPVFGIQNWGERLEPAAAWTDKIRWIEGELETRRAQYPELVNKGRLTEAEANARIRAIAQLRRLYWERLFMWEPPIGPALDYLVALRNNAIAGADPVIHARLRKTDGAQIFYELVRRHMAAIDAEHEKRKAA